MKTGVLINGVCNLVRVVFRHNLFYFKICNFFDAPLDSHLLYHRFENSFSSSNWTSLSKVFLGWKECCVSETLYCHTINYTVELVMKLINCPALSDTISALTCKIPFSKNCEMSHPLTPKVSSIFSMSARCCCKQSS